MSGVEQMLAEWCLPGCRSQRNACDLLMQIAAPRSGILSSI
jgi:hypothetical protein